MTNEPGYKKNGTQSECPKNSHGLLIFNTWNVYNAIYDVTPTKKNLNARRMKLTISLTDISIRALEYRQAPQIETRRFPDLGASEIPLLFLAVPSDLPRIP
jgi:hypothetical protein